MIQILETRWLVSDSKEELILKPFERISVSKLDTYEMCPRHYHFQFAYGLVEEVSAKQQQNRTLGEQVDAQIEAYLKAAPGTVQLSGAAAAVSRHYPTPGQSCVDVQRWVRGEWAGAPWAGKIDLLTGPSTVWGPLNRPQKHDLVRVTDLKSTSDLKWAKGPDQIDRNRQLHMYASGVWRERQKSIPSLFEVSQVTVERGAPHRCQSIVRISGEKQLLELEEEDRPLVRGLIASHSEEDTLALEPASDRGVCERWYGYRCAFYERCHGKTRVAVPQSLGALMDADGGRGSSGAGRTIDSIAAGSVPVVQTIQKPEEKGNMLATPDAARSQNMKIEGENARYRSRTIVQGKSYIAIQGDRHGKIWEMRMLGDDFKILVGDKLQAIEAAPGFRHLDGGEEQTKGSVPVGTGAKMDIIQLRAVFGPFLQAWDEREAPKKELPAAGEQHLEEDDIFGQAEKQITEQSGVKAPSEDRVKELTSVGLTDAQARSLADGGVTLEALRSGSVAVADLTQCRGIGKGGAEKILARFQKKPEAEKVQKDQSARDEEKITKLSKVESEEKPTVPEQDRRVIEEAREKVLEAMEEHFEIKEYHEIQERAAELEGQLTAARLRIVDLESGSGSDSCVVPREPFLELLDVVGARYDSPGTWSGVARQLREASQSEPRDGFTIYVGCRPDTEVKSFLDVIAPYLDRVAKAKKVADVSQIDPGYTVPGLLNEALHADPPAPCAFVVSDRDQVWGWVRRYFLTRASEVVVASVVP